MSFRLPLLDAGAHYRRVFGRIEIQNRAADQFVFRDADHLQEQAIGEDDMAAIVVDDDSLIDGFEDACHFANPGELRFLHSGSLSRRTEEFIATTS
jgi:hypothetical protein